MDNKKTNTKTKTMLNTFREHLQSLRLLPLRHLIRVMRKHDLTNKKTKTKTMTMTNTFREHHQRGIFTILEYLEFLEYLELGQFRNFCDVLSLPYKRALARPVIKAFNVCDRYLVKRNDQL